MEEAARTSRNQPWRWLLALVILFLPAVFLIWLAGQLREQLHHDAPPLVFDESSEKLKQTVILPTLETPIPEGKSAIWCSSFQIAWNQFKSDITKGAIQIKNVDPELLKHLNDAKQGAGDLSPEDYYAAAGLTDHGIVEKIHRDMATKFPNTPVMDLNFPSGFALAYAYLQAAVRYRLPYLEHDKPFTFVSSQGDQTAVTSFGTVAKGYDAHELSNQVGVLYVAMQEHKADEFALDLCKDTGTYQVVIACMKRSGTLAAGLADLRAKSTKFSSQPDDEGRFSPLDTLLVPNMHWRIQHRFEELEGADKLVQNAPVRNYPLIRARQMIHFKMDRYGTAMKSEALMAAGGIGRHFHFNRPFLIYLKKRDAQHPFLVMWVDNAELLSKWGNP